MDDNHANHTGHIDINPSTSLHDLTPEQFQQFQQILRGLLPVSSERADLTELAHAGGHHHAPSQFRGEGDLHHTQVHGQEAVASFENHDATLALPLVGLPVPAPHNQATFPTFSAYPSAYHALSNELNTIPTVGLSHASTDTTFINDIAFNNLAPDQGLGPVPTIDAQAVVSAPVWVPQFQLPEWHFHLSPNSQNLLNQDYILPPTWSHATTTDAGAADPAPPILIIPSSSSSSFAPVIPGSVYPHITPAPTHDSSAIPSQLLEHHHAGTISPELVRLSRPFVVPQADPHQHQYHRQHQLPLQLPLQHQHQPSLSLPLRPLTASHGTSSASLVSGFSNPQPQTQTGLDVELVSPVLSTSVPSLVPDPHGSTPATSIWAFGGEPHSDNTVGSGWSGWSGGDGGDGGDGLSDVSESEDEGEDDHHTPAGTGGGAIGEFEGEDGDEACHVDDGGYDTEHEHEHEHDRKHNHRAVADDNDGADTDTDTDTDDDDDDDDDDSESSFSATSHLSDPLRGASIPSPPRTPAHATDPSASSTTNPGLGSTTSTMGDMVPNFTPSDSVRHIRTPSATRHAIGVGNLHVTLTDSPVTSPLTHRPVGAGVGLTVSVTPSVESVMYTSAEYPVPQEMWDGEEEMEMKVEVEEVNVGDKNGDEDGEDGGTEADVADVADVANDDEADVDRPKTNEVQDDLLRKIVGIKQARGSTRSMPKARSVPNSQLLEEGTSELHHESVKHNDGGQFVVRSHNDSDSASHSHSASEPDSDSDSDSNSNSGPETDPKDQTYQPRFGPTTRSSARYQRQHLPSHQRTNAFWTGPLRAVAVPHSGEDRNPNSIANAKSKSISKSIPRPKPKPSSKSGPSSKSTTKSLKQSSGRIKSKVLVTGSVTGTTVTWSGPKAKATGSGRRKKGLSDEAKINVESLRERLEATASRSHINFDEKVFRVLVDERFTEYIHWAELENGSWGVVIPRENEFDTIVAPYLRNKAHAQRGAVRRQWSTYGFRTGQATTIQGVSVYHISHPLLKREDEALWEIVRSLSQLQLRGPSDPTTKQPSKVERLTSKNEQLLQQLRVALETNEALLVANAALEQRIRDISARFPGVGNYLATLPHEHGLSKSSACPGPGPGPDSISQAPAPHAVADFDAAPAPAPAATYDFGLRTSRPMPPATEDQLAPRLPQSPFELQIGLVNPESVDSAASTPIHPLEVPARTVPSRRGRSGGPPAIDFGPAATAAAPTAAAAFSSSGAHANAPVPPLETLGNSSIPNVSETEPKSRNKPRNKGKERCPDPVEEPERTLRHKRSKLSRAG